LSGLSLSGLSLSGRYFFVDARRPSTIRRDYRPRDLFFLEVTARFADFPTFFATFFAPALTRVFVATALLRTFALMDLRAFFRGAFFFDVTRSTIAAADSLIDFCASPAALARLPNVEPIDSATLLSKPSDFSESLRASAMTLLLVHKSTVSEVPRTGYITTRGHQVCGEPRPITAAREKRAAVREVSRTARKFFNR
jgi:hypothetical protein